MSGIRDQSMAGAGAGGAERSRESARGSARVMGFRAARGGGILAPALRNAADGPFEGRERGDPQGSGRAPRRGARVPERLAARHGQPGLPRRLPASSTPRPTSLCERAFLPEEPGEEPRTVESGRAAARTSTWWPSRSPSRTTTSTSSTILRRRRHPAAVRRPGRALPAGRGGRHRRPDQPGAGGPLLRPLPGGRGGGAPALRSSTPCAGGRRGRPRAELAAAPWPGSPAPTSPSLYDVAYADTRDRRRAVGDPLRAAATARPRA